MLVTGATGFVGSTLCPLLTAAGYDVRRALRSRAQATSADAVVGNVDGDTDWREAMRGIDAVVHLAARTHVLDDTASDPFAEYRRVNVDGTKALGEAAIEAGVRRFVFMSSIKVNGERTGATAFRESDPPRPEDAYGVTKLEAEEWLAKRAQAAGAKLAVLRPPLVYGPGVKGNFLRLMRLVDRGVPLPLKSVRNRRSLVYVGNLADAALTVLRNEAAGTYLVADGAALSTPDLIEGIASALGRKAKLVSFPPALLELAGRVAGKAGEVGRLTGSLEVDSSLIRRQLQWQPPYSPAQGLAESARWYHSHLRARSRTA